MIPGVLDRDVRSYVYEATVASGVPPTAGQTAQALGVAPDAVRAAFERLAEAHHLVLQRGSREILMAMPFSAVATPFTVKVGAVSYYANCAWDAFGIPVMLKQDARIATSCGCCASSMTLEARSGALEPAAGVVHFAVPAREFWDNIVFT